MVVPPQIRKLFPLVDVTESPQISIQRILVLTACHCADVSDKGLLLADLPYHRLHLICYHTDIVIRRVCYQPSFEVFTSSKTTRLIQFRRSYVEQSNPLTRKHVETHVNPEPKRIPVVDLDHFRNWIEARRILRCKSR